MAGPFPIPKFHFKVTFSDWGGEIAFKEVTGLSQEYETMEYRAGSDSFYTEKRNGLIKSSPVTFKKGIFSDDTALTAVLNDHMPAKDKFFAETEDPGTIVIELMNEKGETKAKWELLKCVPTKMNFSDMSSDSSEVAIEELEVNYAVMKFGIPDGQEF